MSEEVRPADEQQEGGPKAPVRRTVKRRVPKRRGDSKGRRPRRRRKKRGHREIKELPPLTFLIGGDEARWFVPAVLVGALLMSAWGASSIGSANTPMFRMISMEHQGIPRLHRGAQPLR